MIRIDLYERAMYTWDLLPPSSFIKRLPFGFCPQLQGPHFLPYTFLQFSSVMHRLHAINVCLHEKVGMTLVCTYCPCSGCLHSDFSAPNAAPGGRVTFHMHACISFHSLFDAGGVIRWWNREQLHWMYWQILIRGNLDNSSTVLIIVPSIFLFRGSTL